jgi:hypothetical protein
MFAILHPFLLWHEVWRGGKVHLACDNSSVVDVINKHTIKGPAIVPLQRIFLIAAVYDMQILPTLTGLSITALEDPRLDLIIRGGKRIYGEDAKAIRYPITSDILHMLNEIKHDEEEVNIKTALCVGFAAFL